MWILWKGQCIVQPIYLSSQAVTVEMRLEDHRKVVVSCVYASCLKRIRQELWSHLDVVCAQLQSTTSPWVVAGDFNIIADSSEKRGGLQVDVGAVQDFQNFIHRNMLIDMGFIGDIFTWCNNRQGRARIWERLDRVLANLEVQSLFPSLTVSYLPRITSDHSPLLVRWEVKAPRISAGFIFQRMWADHANFNTPMATDWAKPMAGPPGLKFWCKLVRLKHTLKNWNWTIFGDVFKKKSVLLDKI